MLDLVSTPVATLTKYETAWTNITDWTNIQIAVTHNLGVPLSQLLVQFLYSTDGTDANSRQANFSQYNSTNSTAGFQVYANDNNSFNIQTGAGGIAQLTYSTGGLDLIDTESYYYKIVVVRLY